MKFNSLNRLKYFNDLSITGSYSKSAQRLGIAQPALSIAIRKLEEEVGLKLINRTDRQMTLTSDGRMLLKHVQTILASINEASRELTELKGLEYGEINIGASAMLSTYYLPQWLLAFKKQYPGILIRLYEAGTNDLERMVIDGKLDLALLQSDNENPAIRYRPHIKEQVVACLPAFHPLADKTTLSIEDFCQQPVVLFRKGYYLRESIEKRAKEAGLTLNIQFETNLVDLLKQLVSQEIGIATSLEMIIGNDASLCTRPFDPPITLELAWSWKKNHYLSKASQALLDFLVQTSKASH